MFFHSACKHTENDATQHALQALLIAGVVGLFLLYAKTVKTFVQVFVRVFLEEMGTEAKKV